MGGDDVLEGNDGKDSINGDGLVKIGLMNSVAGPSHGADFLDGGLGNDSLTGGGGNDVVYGGGDNDSMWGDASGRTSDAGYLDVAYHGADYMDGENGDDTIEGGGKDDTLYGGSGNDALWGDTSADFVEAGTNALIWGNDYLDGEEGDDELKGGGKDDQLYGGAGKDKLWGDESNLLLAGEANGADYLDGEDGDDQLIGGGRDDALFGGSGNDALFGDDDLINLAAEFHGNDYLDGEDGDDYLAGEGGDDVLMGGLGNDVLDGGTGADFMDGGTGDDTYVVDNVGDVAAEQDAPSAATASAAPMRFAPMAATNAASTVPSFDTVQTSVSYTLGANLEILTLTGTGTINGTGNELANGLYGNSANNTLTGGDGDDYLQGGDGNDTLIGGTGGDAMIGGAGDDVYVIDAGDVPTGFYEVISDTLGNNQVHIGSAVSAASTSSANAIWLNVGDANSASQLRLEGALTGSFSQISTDGGPTVTMRDWLQANVTSKLNIYSETAIVSWGGGGDDVLKSGRLGGVFYGGHGNDYFDLGGLAGASGAVVQINGGDGADSLYSYLQGEPGVARPASQIVFGAGIVASSVQLEMRHDPAKDDAPTLVMRYGIQGDSLWITGNDYWDDANNVYARPFDSFEFADGTALSWDQLVAQGVAVTADYLGSRIDGGSYRDLVTGTASREMIYAERGDDVIDGGLGNDDIDAGLGSDTMVFGLGDGADRIVVSERDTADKDALRFKVGIVAGDLQCVRLVDDLVIKVGAGGDIVTVVHAFTDNPLDHIEFADGGQLAFAAIPLMSAAQQATQGADVLYLVPAGETVNALGGDDTVYGGIGNDVILGGGGNDTLNGGAGNDSLEDLVGNNVLMGGAGNDVVRGSGTLDGGLGDDLIEPLGGFTVVTQVLVGTGADTLLIGPNAGHVFVDGYGEHLSNVIERKPLMVRFGAGIQPQDVVFEAVMPLLNMANENQPNDGRLRVSWNTAGQSGWLEIKDFMLLPALAADQFVFEDAPVASRGFDAVLAQLRTQTTGPDVLFGTVGNDVIEGGAGNDLLYGVAGNDLLRGGAGDDTLAGYSGAVVYEFNLGDGADTILNLWPQYWDPASSARLRDDTLQLGAGLLPSDVVAMHDSSYYDNVRLAFKSSADEIKILGNFYYSIGQIVFADGTRWTGAQLNAMIQDPTEGADLIEGSGRADILKGLGGDDTIYAGAGSDTISAGTGNNFVDAGAGNDVISVYGNDVVLAGDGDDRVTIWSAAGGADVTGGKGNDLLNLYSTDPTILRFDLGDGVDTVSMPLSRNPLLVFSAAVAQSTSSVRYMASGAYGSAKLTISYGQQGDKVEVPVNSVNGKLPFFPVELRFQFGAGPVLSYHDLFGDVPMLEGSDGNDTLYQTVIQEGPATVAQDTVFRGGKGDDLVYGGMGNDTYRFYLGDGNDTITEGVGRYDWSTDRLVFGPGIAVADISVHRVGNDAVLNHVNGTDSVTVRDWFAAGDLQIESVVFADGVVWTASQVNALVVGNHPPTVVNTPPLQTMVETQNFSYTVPDNTFVDVNEGDHLVLSATLEGGAALPDWLVFDPNSQTFTGIPPYTGGASVVFITLTATDMMGATATTAFTLAISHIVNGTANADNLMGTPARDVLYGLAGDDTLDGGALADSLLGGLGNDVYLVDDAGDVVVENSNEGSDIVLSSSSYTLSSNVENLTLVGVQSIDGTGNALNNVLIGNAGYNALLGGAGDDVLDGKAGNDTMVGGTGNDAYFVSGVGDAVTELVDEGVDTVNAVVSYTLGVNLENLILTGTAAINGTGNALDNVFTGNSTANVLSGGAGNDTYVVGAGDSTVEAVGAGTDTIQSAIAWTLATNIENLVLTGSSAVKGTGNTANNMLIGNSGANTLDGSTGADSMAGGAGNDIYMVDNAADLVTENLNEGTDLVQAGVGYTLTANVENLTLSGTSALSGSGNSLANTLTGNAGNNVLDGGAGADTLIGGAGNDTYYVDSTADVTTEGANAGTDLVMSNVNWTLATNLERLTLSGIGNLNGTGNSAANLIIGNVGDNILDGATGIDTLIGGAGNDTYVIDVAGDVVTENSNEGTDTAKSAATYTLGANLENLTLTGTSAVNGTGNALNNALTGNTAKNTLNGGAGNDTLDGKGGVDTLVGGSGNDTYRLGRGYGSDTITENDATAGNTDVALFDTGIAVNQLWFLKAGNNLDVSIIGTTDKFTLTNWYLGNQYHVEQFKTSDGHVLLDSAVQNLVQAMAAFAPPAAGQITLVGTYATALEPVIAANWI
jgi:Ca2+-binding RTX toxin-like protein